jgi:hypothetical protein
VEASVRLPLQALSISMLSSQHVRARFFAIVCTPGPHCAWHSRIPRQVEPASLGGLKERAAATTLCLTPADHRRLRKVAIDRGVSMQTLILDALDPLITRENEAPVERKKSRRKRYGLPRRK